MKPTINSIKNSIIVQNPNEKLELKVNTQGKIYTASKSKIN